MLLQKYINNECTPQELEQVLHYLQGAGTDQVLHELIDADAQKQMQSAETIDPALYEAMRAGVQTGIRNKRKGEAKGGTVRPMEPVYGSLRRMAAIFILLLLLGGISYRLALRAGTVTHSTAYGQTATVTLPDNSQVTLNGNSSLRYSSNDWQDGQPREVFLEGEAFFSVVHTESDQRFIVHTSDRFNVEVLGTTFNVNHRRGNTQVVLNSGKVKLKLEASEQVKNVLMQPGDLVAFSPADEALTKKTVNPEIYSSWKSNRLIFKDTPLTEIARLLEDNYGYQVRIADSALAKEEFTAIYPADNIDILLQALERSFEGKIKTKNKQVFFGTSSTLPNDRQKK